MKTDTMVQTEYGFGCEDINRLTTIYESAEFYIITDSGLSTIKEKYENSYNEKTEQPIIMNI